MKSEKKNRQGIAWAAALAVLAALALLLGGCAARETRYEPYRPAPSYAPARSSGCGGYTTYRYDWKLGNNIRVQSDGRTVRSSVKIGSYQVETTRPATRYR